MASIATTLPPRRSVWYWLRANLFSSPTQTLLTLTSIYVLWVAAPPLVQWALLDATWTGTRDDCVAGAGACWAFVRARFGQFMYGFYPPEHRWRPNLALLVLVLSVVPLFLERFPYKRWVFLYLFLIYPLIAVALLHGGPLVGLETVPTERWGGFMLTLVVAVSGMAGSLPLGVLLALGRRSKLPTIRIFSVCFIELFRAVPLITVLFMASVMLPLFLPSGVTLDKLLRALIGVAVFNAALMAEVVRGGLQAISKGQYEAAAAIGLGYWQTMAFVVLPQALRIVIPGIVNTYVAIIKDTTLVLIIGLFDLLGIVQAGVTDPNWLAPTVTRTGYAFAAMGFWILCFALSRYSIYLEGRLHRGHRRH